MGYEDQKEDYPRDRDTWKKYAKDVRAFNQDFLEACLEDGDGTHFMEEWRPEVHEHLWYSGSDGLRFMRAWRLDAHGYL